MEYLKVDMDRVEPAVEGATKRVIVFAPLKAISSIPLGVRDDS